MWQPATGTGEQLLVQIFLKVLFREPHVAASDTDGRVVIHRFLKTQSQESLMWQPATGTGEQLFIKKFLKTSLVLHPDG